MVDFPKSLESPPYKGFHGRVMGKSEVGVEAGGGGVSFFGSLPELAGIAALERHHVFLGLVDEYAESLLQYLVGTHGHGHLDLFDVPFLPRSLVEPKPAILDPFVAGGLDSLQGFQRHVETND